MLNAIGLQNVGVDRFIVEKIPYLGTLGVPIIVNILGDSLDEYRHITEKLSACEVVAAIEINISCPNVKRAASPSAPIRRWRRRSPVQSGRRPPSR